MVERRSVLALLLAGAASAADSYAIVGGTVFRDSGFALPGAEVSLEPAVTDPVTPDGNKRKRKSRKLSVITSPRGEFTFRVPPEAARYKLSVAARDFEPSEKIVETHGGEERVEATFTLSPKSK